MATRKKENDLMLLFPGVQHQRFIVHEVVLIRIYSDRNIVENVLCKHSCTREESDEKAQTLRYGVKKAR